MGLFVGERAIIKRGFQRRSSSSLMVACTTLPRILKSIRYAFDWYTVATAITARGSRTRSCARLTVTSISIPTSPFPTPPNCSLPRYARELQLQLQLPCIGQATAERYAWQTAEQTDSLGPYETIPLCAKGMKRFCFVEKRIISAAANLIEAPCCIL